MPIAGTQNKAFRLFPQDEPALDTLDDQTRDLLKFAANGNSYNRCAKAFDMRLGTVRSRLSRARAKVIAARQAERQ